MHGLRHRGAVTINRLDIPTQQKLEACQMCQQTFDYYSTPNAVRIEMEASNKETLLQAFSKMSTEEDEGDME